MVPTNRKINACFSDARISSRKTTFHCDSQSTGQELIRPVKSMGIGLCTPRKLVLFASIIAVYVILFKSVLLRIDVIFSWQVPCIESPIYCKLSSNLLLKHIVVYGFDLLLGWAHGGSFSPWYCLVLENTRTGTSGRHFARHKAISRTVGTGRLNTAECFFLISKSCKLIQR